MRAVGLGLAWAFAIAGQAIADTNGAGAMAIFGYEFVRDPGEGCNISISLDQGKFISSVPSLKMLGMLNAEFVTQTRVNLQPTVLAITFAMEMAPATIKDVFGKNPKAQVCVFKQYVTGNDDLGNARRELAFSFSFSRDLYLKINWDNFEYFKLPVVAHQFALAPDVNLVMREETAALPPE